MKLSYRGKEYEYETSAFQMMEGEPMGKYRGQTWNNRYPYPRHIPVPQASLDLKYRGVAYRTNPRLDLEAVLQQSHPVAPAVVSEPQTEWASLSDLANPLQLRQVFLKEVADIHRSNIYRSLERRLKVAQERGDQQLIGLLEQELHQIA